jgi:hypothetical protein
VLLVGLLRWQDNAIRCTSDFGIRGLFDYLLNLYTEDDGSHSASHDLPQASSEQRVVFDCRG